MTILISGGTSGIGFEMARQLLFQGHKLILLGKQTLTFEKQKELQAVSMSFEAFVCDLNQPEEIKKIGQQIIEKYSYPDILVNNAGYATYQTFEEMSSEEIERLVSVNFMGAVRLTKFFLKGFQERRSGVIFNISSIAGEIVMTPNIMYMSAKQALNAWSLALSYELSVYEVKVQTFCPGRVDTAFFNHPTFLSRRQRPEMKKALSASEVAKKAISQLFSSVHKSYIPRHYRFIAWIYRAVPGVEGWAFARLMKKRVQDYYQGESS